jgi:outer membrane protein OmpA-like peptidoglycan-associated protein
MKKFLFVTSFLFVCLITMPAVSQDSSLAKKSNIQVLNNMDAKVFNYPASGDVDLTNEIKDFLDVVVDYLKNNPHSTVRIVGHSDKSGILKENIERSKLRAEAAKTYLVSKGISKGRIFERGVGSTMPLVSEHTEADRTKNRRIEITVVN